MERNEKERVDILNGNIALTLFRLCLPILICGIAQQIYNMCDLAIVGKIDERSVAIISGSSSLLSSVATNFVGGLVSGAIVIIGNAYGRGNQKEVEKTIITAFLLMGGMTLLFVFLYFLFGTPVLRFLNVPYTMLSDSSRFLKVYSIGFFGYGMFQLSINILRSFGETRKPTLLLINSFILNIIFDFLIIVVLKAGYLGVGFAYILTQFVSFGLAFKVIKKDVKLSSHLEFDHEIAFSILKVGIPSAIISLAFSLTSTYVQSFFNLLGETWISAYGVYAKFERIFWIVMNGLQLSLCTFIAQNYGARNYTRIHRGIRIAGLIFVSATAGCSLAVLMGSSHFISLFLSNPETIENCLKIIRFMAPFYPAYALIELFTGIFKGTKKANIPLVLNLLFICLLRYLWLSLYARNHLTYLNICWCWPISWFVSSAAYLMMYLIKKKNIFV